jgi:hypothetical protein
MSSGRDVNSIVSLDQLAEKYAALKRTELTEPERAFSKEHRLDGHELLAKIRLLSAVGKDKILQGAFREASGGETGVWEDKAGKSYISGGFDGKLRAMMNAELRKNADPDKLAYIDRINALELQAFAECDNLRPQVGTLRPIPLDREARTPAPAVVTPARPSEPAAPSISFEQAAPPPASAPKQEEKPHSLAGFLHRLERYAHVL